MMYLRMNMVSVVLVTNVGQGFGRAVALAYGKANYDVVCVDSDVELASKIAAEIEEFGGQAIPIQSSMSNASDVRKAFDKVFEIFGDLSGLVHVTNFTSRTPFTDVNEGELAELFEGTLRSTFLTLKIAMRYLDKAWMVIVAPAQDSLEPQMTAIRGGLEAFVKHYQDHARYAVNLVVPSRQSFDPFYDAALAYNVMHLGATDTGIRGQCTHVKLPVPPTITESLLPEVQAALDESIGQEELEAYYQDYSDENTADEDVDFIDEFDKSEYLEDAGLQVSECDEQDADFVQDDVLNEEFTDSDSHDDVDDDFQDDSLEDDFTLAENNIEDEYNEYDDGFTNVQYASVDEPINRRYYTSYRLANYKPSKDSLPPDMLEPDEELEQFEDIAEDIYGEDIYKSTAFQKSAPNNNQTSRRDPPMPYPKGFWISTNKLDDSSMDAANSDFAQQEAKERDCVEDGLEARDNFSVNDDYATVYEDIVSEQDEDYDKPANNNRPVLARQKRHKKK